MKARFLVASLCALLMASGGAIGDERIEYNRRAIERFGALFAALDRNGDGVVTREEARGDLNFVPHFEDMDIDRNNAVTRAELDRFLSQRYELGVR
jgi:hypothetical protein